MGIDHHSNVLSKIRVGLDAYESACRLGRQDKARFLASRTPFLSFCLHIVFAPLGFDAVRCGDGAPDAIILVFNGLSAIARNVRGRRDRTAYADASVSTLVYDVRISLLSGAF
jgi:hypothetical protein